MFPSLKIAVLEDVASLSGRHAATLWGITQPSYGGGSKFETFEHFCQTTQCHMLANCSLHS